MLVVHWPSSRNTPCISNRQPRIAYAFGPSSFPAATQFQSGYVISSDTPCHSSTAARPTISPRTAATAIRNRRIELTQSQHDTPIDETELYLSVVECDDKGRIYGLGWIPSGSRRRHTGAGAGSSRPIYAHGEPIEQLRKDIKEMQTNILWVMQDNTLNREELRVVQGQSRLMEQALMDKLGISFTPPRDAEDDDSETEHDLDD
ncbi:hypothetical protein Scep_006833 [Stephania cephalantha]|uniref:Uncharacterized protein n=1 Tax=Stephania cephalantha TaxID=152367 RepID=A0AAP0PPF2_9MAGN